MFHFTKTVSCVVIRTAQQIDTKPMHLCENFRQNLLVKFYFIKDFNFNTRVETDNSFSLLFVVLQNIGNLRACHVLLNVFV